MPGDATTERAKMDDIVAKLAKTSDVDRRERLVEDASLKCPNLAPEAAVTLLGAKGKRERIGGAALLGQLCITQPGRLPEFAGLLVEAFDRETAHGVLVSIVAALRRACQSEGPMAYWTDRPIKPDGHRAEVWPLLTAERCARIKELDDSDDSEALIDLAAALDEFDLRQPDLRETLLLLLQDESDYVIDMAVATATKRPDADGEDVRELLWDRAKHDDYVFRNAAIGALLVRHDPKAIDAAKRALREPEVTEELFAGIAAGADPALLEPLVERARSHKDDLWSYGSSFPPALLACGATDAEIDGLRMA